MPHHRSTSWVATVPCCSVASVRKRLQASGIERSRRSEAEKLHSGCRSCKSHNSRSFHAILSTVSSHTTNDLHAVLCRAISRISIVVSYRPMESCRCLFVSVLLVVSMMLTVSCVTCELHGFQSFFSFSWLVDCSLETMRWQADASCSRGAAPRRCLESIFRLHLQTNHQNTRIWCRGYHNTICSERQPCSASMP